MRMKFSGRNLGRAAFCLLALLWLAASGCKTYSGPPENNLALVTITNRPLAEVQTAVTNVFLAHGYTVGLVRDNSFTFTRKTGGMDHLIYGSYVFGDNVLIKAGVITRQMPDDTIGVSCNAWIDAAEDDPIFEGDHEKTALRKKPYQALLEEVKQKLGE